MDGYKLFVFKPLQGSDNFYFLECGRMRERINGVRGFQGREHFPFERVPGAVIERGLGAKYCIAKEDNTVFFFGDDRVFYRLNGLNPTRIS
ncbi:MAG: hypothetical protein AABY01_00970, partial [Nanoarchaeota archaeon]